MSYVFYVAYVVKPASLTFRFYVFYVLCGKADPP
jgi:hypothetical protein